MNRVELILTLGTLPYKTRGIWDPVYKNDIAITDIKRLKFDYK